MVMNIIHTWFVVMFRKLPPLKALLAFSAASRSHSFSQAAEDLFITQSAVSHQIKNLETFLGCKLFYREGKSLKLSEQGQQLAQTVNQGFDQIVATIQEITGQLDNALQFGVSSTFAVHRITPEMSELNLKNPTLDLRLRMLSCSDPIPELGLDVILYDTKIDHISYECEEIKQEVYYPVASPEIAKKLQGMSPSLWHQCVKFIDIQGLDIWQDWFDENKILIEEIPRQYFGHNILVMQSVLTSQGIALLGETLIKKELLNGQLVKLTNKGFSFENDGFYFSWHKRRKNDPNIRILKNWLLGLIL